MKAFSDGFVPILLRWFRFRMLVGRSSVGRFIGAAERMNIVLLNPIFFFESLSISVEEESYLEEMALMVRRNEGD